MNEHKPAEITLVDLYGFSYRFEAGRRRRSKRGRHNLEQAEQAQNPLEMTLLDVFDSVFTEHGLCDGFITYDNSNATRTYNCLRRGGYTTLGLLAKANPSDLSEIRGFGPKSLDVVRNVLSTYGLRLADEESAQEETQNPLEIELSTLLEPTNSTDTRVFNCLKRSGIETLGDLQKKFPQMAYVNLNGTRLCNIRGFGQKSHDRLEQIAKEFGIKIYSLRTSYRPEHFEDYITGEDDLSKDYLLGLIIDPAGDSGTKITITSPSLEQVLNFSREYVPQVLFEEYRGGLENLYKSER